LCEFIATVLLLHKKRHKGTAFFGHLQVFGAKLVSDVYF